MKKKLSASTISIIFVTLCITLWSLIPTFAKFAQNSLDSFQYLFYSSIISFLSLFIISILTKNIRQIFTYPLQTLIFLAFLGFLDFLYYVLLYFGYKFSNGLEVLVMQYTWPIFIVIFSFFLLKEEFTKNKILSLLFGFLGVMLVLTKGNILSIDLTNMKVNLLVLFCSMSFALFSVLSKKVKISPINAIMIYFFVSIFYSFISMQTFSNFIFPKNHEWFFIAINGVFLNGISYIFWIVALKNSDASFIAPFIFIIPLLSAFFIILFFDEEIYFIYFIGLFFVILSGIINVYKRHKL